MPTENTYPIKWMQDKDGDRYFPITHLEAVRDENNANLETLLGEKQDELVSTVNIKTINGVSILGSGNLSIQTSGGGEMNTIDTVKVNGTALVPDSNKAVDVTVPTESTVSGWGFTKNTGTYSKPSGGIPATDLASAVQTSLGKADTALQSFTETDPTVPSWAKASSKPSYTASEVGAVPTTRTVNGMALSADITLSASDVSALPASTPIPAKTSDLTNDSNFITSADIPEGAAASTTTPLMDGTAAVGTETRFARGDHRHPTDTSRQAAITSSSKLSADLIQDGTTNKTVTATEKTTWNNKGTYSKPSGGIPKTDLASAVQTSLGLADTALQSFTETDPVFSASAASEISSSDISNWNSKTSNIGTITGITMNGASKGTSGVVDLGTVITAHQDISGKADKSATVSSVDYNTTSKKITKTINGTTSDVVTAAKIVTDGGGITSHQDISGKADKATTLAGYGITDAKIANGIITLGSNTITPLTSFTESDPVFGASAAAGITSSDISNWNSKTSNVGTITGINMNGASKGTSGVVDLGTVITAHQDISGKADKTATVSTVAYDTTNHKITKTINGTTTDVVTAATIVQDGGGATITFRQW